MNCKKAAPWLPLLADNRLDEPLRGQVEAHVQGCTACQTELGDLRRAVEFLHAARRPEPSRDFKNAIMASAGPELAKRSARVTRRLRRPVPVWDRPAVRWALAPVTAVFVLLGAWLYAIAPQTPVPIVRSTPASTSGSVAAITPTEEINVAANRIAESAAGQAVTGAIRRVMGIPRERAPMPTPQFRMMVAAPAPPAASTVPAPKPFPATTGRVQPRLTESGPVGYAGSAPTDLIASTPKSTHARPYMAETGDEVASGLAGGLIANEVVLSDVITKVAAESAVTTLTPRGPSYRDVPRLAFSAPKAKTIAPGAPTYDDVPRLVFPGSSAPATDGAGAPVEDKSSSAPGAGGAGALV